MKTVFASACALLIALPAWGTTLLLRDLPALSRTSDAIVVGQVVDAKSRWSSDGRKIFTEVTVEVGQTWKGGAEGRVIILQPGGQVGDIGQKVSGLATFAVGDEVVVFLERRGEERFVVNGMAQGKYRVERSSDKKAAYAVPDGNVRDARVLDPVTRQETEPAATTLTLEALRQKVQRALAEETPAEAPLEQKPQGTKVQ